MTAGILVNKGRQLSGVSDEMAGDVYCGGCQTQLKNGHRPGCPAVGQDLILSMVGENEVGCFDCGRPPRLGHSQDCSEMLDRFGVQMGGW